MKSPLKAPDARLRELLGEDLRARNLEVAILALFAAVTLLGG